jgi:hypothetical protein
MFVLVLLKVLCKMSLLVVFTTLFLLPPPFGSTAWVRPWPRLLCSHSFGVPQQLHFVKGGVVSPTPKPQPGGPYLSRECPVLRRQIFALTLMLVALAGLVPKALLGFLFWILLRHIISAFNFCKNFSSRLNSSIQMHILNTQAAVTFREICCRPFRFRELLDQWSSIL